MSSEKKESKGPLDSWLNQAIQDGLVEPDACMHTLTTDRRFLHKFYVCMIRLLLVLGERKSLKRKMGILLLGLVAAGLLAIGFMSMSNFGVVSVSATEWTGLGMPKGVAIGDYDNDGLNDLAFSEFTSGRVAVYKSDGTTVIKQWTGLTWPIGVAIGDYNNDGSNDLAFAEDIGIGGSKVTVYESDGTTVIKQWTGLERSNGVAIGDYNNDGLNDLAFTELWAGRVTVYKSDGTTVIKQWTGLIGPTGVAIGDYNNDGSNDLAFAEVWGNKISVYESDGTTIIKQWTGLSGSFSVAIGDYNNDGLNDLALTEEGPDTVTVYKSDGTTVIKQWTGLSEPNGVNIGDYNNDGLNDLAFTEYLGNRVTVYYQTTPRTAARVAEPTIITLRGTLTNATGYPIQSGSIRVTVKDSFGTQVWQDTFDNIIDNGRYNIPLGTKTKLMLIKGQVYNAILEVDADSPTFVSADVIYGDNNPIGDIIKFVA